MRQNLGRCHSQRSSLDFDSKGLPFFTNLHAFVGFSDQVQTNADRLVEVSFDFNKLELLPCNV